MMQIHWPDVGAQGKYVCERNAHAFIQTEGLFLIQIADSALILEWLFQHGLILPG
jgi:hypothetical protein